MIDTAAKRRSASANSRRYMIGLTPIASPSAAWRMDAARVYSANAVQAVIPQIWTPTQRIVVVARERRTFTLPEE